MESDIAFIDLLVRVKGLTSTFHAAVDVFSSVFVCVCVGLWMCMDVVIFTHVGGVSISLLLNVFCALTGTIRQIVHPVNYNTNQKNTLPSLSPSITCSHLLCK